MMLRSKLLLAQTPIAVALILVSVLFLRTMSALGGDAQNILRDNFRSVLSTQRMKDALEVIDAALVGQLFAKQALSRPVVEAATAQFERELVVQEGNVTEKGEAEATTQLRAAWGAYRAELSAFDPSAADASAVYATRLSRSLSEVRTPADAILALNLDAMVRKNEAVRRVVSRNETLLVVATLVACLLGLLSSGALTARLLQPLRVLSQAVRRVGEGDLNARINIAGGDEISSLAREFNAMTLRMRNYRDSSLGELLEAQEAAQAAIDSLSDPVVVFDVHGNLINVNEAAERLLGLSVDGWQAKLAAIDAPLTEGLQRAKGHVLAGHGPYVPKGFEEAVSASTTEGQRYFLTRATPVYSTSSGIDGVTIVLQDVTRVRLFDELKNDVVATVAHEFRTPLTSLRMAVHLCIDGVAGPITAKQADLLYAAREDTERLQAMVDDLLNVARIQSGSAGLRAKPMAVGELISSAMSTHREDAKEHGLEIHAEPAPQGLMVEVDFERLSLVFNNLIANAIHHTPSGGRIELRVRQSGSSVRFEVADTGPGIAAEFQARVFEKFYQVPGSTSGAAGLGLYISKEVVRSHGGEIGLTSDGGHGSTFWFTLPIRFEDQTSEQRIG
jgi:PAS domain S-box-containing protein